MIDPTLSDDAIRRLIAEATELLEARRRTDLASLICGMSDDELRHLIHHACEELDRRRGPGTENQQEFTYRFNMRLGKKGGRPEIIRHTLVEGKVAQIPLELVPVGEKGAFVGGEHTLRNGDFLVARAASGMITHGVPFNGTYIAEHRPKMTIPDVSDDANILDRLYRYASGIRRELVPEAKTVRRSTLEMIRFYRGELGKLRNTRNRDPALERLDRQFRASYTDSLADESRYLQVVDEFIRWMGAELP